MERTDEGEKADFACTKLPSGQRCEDLPFGSIFFHENDVYFAPRWENAFNSLPDFLNDAISGNAFSKEAQLQSYAEVNASCDGMCGQRVHEQIKAMLID